MSEAMLPRAILFDWDNTLASNWQAICDSMNDALAAMGHPTWTVAEASNRIRASLRDSFPLMFGERWPEAREIYYRSFAARHLAELQPMAGAEALLHSLGRRGIYCAVVSNKNGRYLRAEADHLGWTELFGALVGAGDCARDKPAREPVDRALAPTGIVPGRGVWFVGDTDIDMLCGRNSGCWPVLVRPESPADGEFFDCPPAHHVPDCESLGRFIEKL
jgi:phosphoglycolate phosphatase